MKRIVFQLAFLFCLSPIFGQQTVDVVQSKTSNNIHTKTLKRKVAIARFSNETKYAKSVFYDKDNDPMGKQAADILAAKLAASEKFLLLERSDMDKILKEIQNQNSSINKIGADYIIVGSITEFGRKNVGDVKLFSKAKTQIVEAAVSVRLIDVNTGLIIYSDEAKGEAQLKTKTTLGFGGRSDYDATLSDKAISSAISQLVENIINKCTDNPWKAYFLSYDEDAIIISGGASQGIEVGDEFLVKKKGKKVTNPQTGIKIELPGKKVGVIKVVYVGGDTPQSEYSLVTFEDGDINKDKLQNYYIEEMK